MGSKKMIIAPSILSLHFDHFNSELEQLNKYSDWLHFDVMDGNFVPNISFGPDIFHYFRINSDLFMDVHLMVNDPMYYSDVFASKGADLITFHYESLNSIAKCDELIDHLHSISVKAGITIKPDTNIELLNPILNKVDLVLVMSVNPGFGGQKFMDSSLKKIAYLNNYRKVNNLNYLIEIDGGINDLTAHKAILEGCDALVAGSFIFNNDIKSQIDKLRNC